MDELEGTMWWYHGLHANVLAALERYAAGFNKLLDAGCGTGGVLQLVHIYNPDAQLYGLDISEQACAAARSKSGAEVVQGSVDALPYADSAFDVVVDLDVLGYDLDVNAAMAGFFRVLRPGGTLVLNLAAYQWMLSYHDHAVGQTRRFRRSQAVELLRQSGFRIRYATYWNSLLFPLMVLQRKLTPPTAPSDVRRFHPLVNSLFKAILAVERMMTRMRISLPFGGSIMIIAERPYHT
jgi:SAM-dependent methyltransferase